ncbi:MAG: hypothetical protein R3F11_30170 [Verrucomicrobiales bacterium]
MLTIPKVTNADDAAIGAQASGDLATWIDAELIDAAPDALTYRLPPELAGEAEAFFRALARLR